jgi:pimeloyl-ACP methyl ester carboxylesterase
MPQSVIIGIHGLDNKPAKDVLRDWWEDSLAEGLLRNHNLITRPPVQLTYWADIQYREPLSREEDQEPYLKALGQERLRLYDPRRFDKTRACLQKWGGRTIDKGKDLIGLDEPVEQLLGIKCKDLRDYYSNEEKRKQMRARLSDLLSQHQNDKIFLIAHSMGSIIAYDVLRQLEKTESTKVEHFVTIGSPLGLPLVTLNIRQEFGATRSPENVQRWTNIADPRDRVAIDCNLSDEYGASASGIRPQDVLVHNGYVSPLGNENNHKIYGYLRVPEFSAVLSEFLKA